jgi:hypothetical protein
VLRRFGRHHQRRREQLLSQRHLMQQGFFKAVKRQELGVINLEVSGLRRENQLLRQQLTSPKSTAQPILNS